MQFWPEWKQQGTSKAFTLNSLKYMLDTDLKCEACVWNQLWWIWRCQARIFIRWGHEDTWVSMIMTSCLEFITFHFLIEIVEIWLSVSLTTVKSKVGWHGWLHSQCSLCALWICASLQLWNVIYPILMPAGLACGAWKLTLWFDQVASSKSPACFSLWNSWESNWSYRHFRS